MSAKNFSVALKNARPKKKINIEMRVAMPSPKKSMLEAPPMTSLIDSMTVAMGLKIKSRRLDEITIEVG